MDTALLRRAARLWHWAASRAALRRILPHHRPGCPFTGHRRAFHRATVLQGSQASDYFREAGVTALANTNGGVCTFALGKQLAVYQTTNTPLVVDDDLAPSTDANRELFGDFMGSLPNHHPDRPAKRATVERVLGNARFIDGMEPAVRRHAAAHLESVADRELALDEFALSLVAYPTR